MVHSMTGLAMTGEIELKGYEIEGVQRPGAIHKGRVLLGRKGDQECVIKDLSPMLPFYRILFGRRNLRREARVLEELHDFPGSPLLVERISRDAIAIARVPTIYKYLRTKIPRRYLPRVLDAFEATVKALHERGYVHLDLRQRKNVLIPDHDQVVLVDFESCRRFTGPLGRNLIFPFLARIDRAAVLKWRAKMAPETLDSGQMRCVRRYRVWKVFWPWKRLGKGMRRLLGSDRKKN